MIRALLAGAIDYAGLFPPAAMPMPDAARAYHTYRLSPDRWALGRFVVPVSRLTELVAAAEAYWHEGDPWRVSVLPGPDLTADADRIAEFNRLQAERAVIDSIEAKAEDTAQVDGIELAFGRGIETFVEVPVAHDPAPILASLAARGMRAKIRTGGVTAGQFPAPSDVARFLATCARLQLPFKATAGLHHPIRAEYQLTYEADAPRGTMYGFLNIFAAAAAARAGAAEHEIVELLETRDAGRLPLDGDSVERARDHFALSFGSCSFEEPLADLRAMGLL